VDEVNAIQWGGTPQNITVHLHCMSNWFIIIYHFFLFLSCSYAVISVVLYHCAHPAPKYLYDCFFIKFFNCRVYL